MKQPHAREHHRLPLSQSELQLLRDAHLDFVMRQLINSHCSLFPFPLQEVTEAEQSTADRQACLPSSLRGSALPVRTNHRRTGRGAAATPAIPLANPGSVEYGRSLKAERAVLDSAGKLPLFFPRGRDFSAGASRGRHRMGIQ